MGAGARGIPKRRPGWSPHQRASNQRREDRHGAARSTSGVASGRTGAADYTQASHKPLPENTRLGRRSALPPCAHIARAIVTLLAEDRAATSTRRWMSCVAPVRPTRGAPGPVGPAPRRGGRRHSRGRTGRGQKLRRKTVHRAVQGFFHCADAVSLGRRGRRSPRTTAVP